MIYILRVLNSDYIMNRFEKIPRHSATLCYVPLLGLCTYEKSNKTGSVFDTLFPRNLSPFIRLCFSGTSEVFQDAQASSKVFESPLFQAIVKYKWHAFARWRFFVWFFSYLIYFASFTAATSNITRNKQLMILSMIIGAISSLSFIRCSVINMMNGTGIRYFIVPTTHIIFSLSILPIVIGFLEYGDNATHSILRFPTIVIFWIGFFGFLCVFRNIGIFCIGKSCISSYLIVDK